MYPLMARIDSPIDSNGTMRWGSFDSMRWSFCPKHPRTNRGNVGPVDCAVRPNKLVEHANKDAGTMTPHRVGDWFQPHRMCLRSFPVYSSVSYRGWEPSALRSEAHVQGTRRFPPLRGPAMTKIHEISGTSNPARIGDVFFIHGADGDAISTGLYCSMFTGGH